MSEPRPFPTVREFLLDAPLYTKFKIEVFTSPLNALYRKEKMRFDGHCPYCHQSTTFTLGGQHLSSDTAWHNIESRISRNDIVEAVCARNDHHVINFKLFINKLIIEKIGQFPSLADIASDQSKDYKGVLNREDSSEFYKAIGLAAHGVGIGSFVYLRRIFERLIERRFIEHREDYWDDSDFYPKRMSEKIELLHDHLPSFLTENAKIYSIMSSAIHELSEEICLSFFPIIKHSIIIILEEDKKLKEEAAQRESFAKSIRDFEAWEANQIAEGKLT